MHITNKYNLPQSIVDLAKESQYKFKSDSYSATTLLLSNREILLSRRHNDEMEVDVSDMVNMLIGTSVHSLIEKFDKTEMAEVYFKQEILPNRYLTGKVDLYDEKNFTLVDYKTASVWKVQFSDFEDWKTQGLIYAWLLTKSGKFVEKLCFYAILKDWTARDKRLKGSDYPESQIYTWEYKVTTKDLEDIEQFIYTRFNELVKLETIDDDNLPDCENTWYTGDKWAVYKKLGVARADRVFDTEQEAKDYIANKLDGVGNVVYREGEHRKCQDYCDCCKFCKYYKEREVK